MNLISVENLGKRFNREWIFRKLSQTFEAGNTYAVIGPNGSGKSTLMQLLWGQLPPSAGTLSYHNKEKEIEPEQVYKHIAIAAPYMDLIDEFTLQEQLTFHFKLKSARDGVTLAEMPDRMNLKSAANKFIGNFSSGMKQRVKLALAFYTKADAVFLDEPGTNLDKQAFQWYKEELKKLPSSVMVFIASNNPDEFSVNDTVINIQDFK